MAINQNHLFEELNGVKCAVVEKNAGAERVSFLRKILEYNGYTVMVVPSPPPKVPVAEPGPETFTVGVTDVMFNPVNAIFGRLLKTPGGQVVGLAYWQGKSREEGEERPYFER
jgi:hypothetical protein